MEATAKAPANLEMLLDVRVKLTVELCACQLAMRDVLQLNIGSVVKLDKTAQAPVDLYVNAKRIARGEIVGLYGLLGSGRSEFVNAVYGNEPKDSGEVFVEGRRVDIRTPADALRCGMAIVT